jgi:hypothetical protein
MPHDSIPNGDADFNNFVTTLGAFVASPASASYGVTTDQSTALNFQLPVWTTAYAASTNLATAGPAATTRKSEVRTALEVIVRPIVKVLPASPLMTDTLRTTLGLHRSDHTHTPAAVPATVPVLAVDFSVRLEHSITARDSATPNSKARGAMSSPPSSPAENQFNQEPSTRKPRP